MRERVPPPVAVRGATPDPTLPLRARDPLTQLHDGAPIGEASESPEMALDLGTHATGRALGRLPLEKLRQLEATEHLIVSIMISREIRNSVQSLVNDHPSELGNLLTALAGFRHEVYREMDQGLVEIYPPAKVTASLSQVIAEFKAAKGQE